MIDVKTNKKSVAGIILILIGILLFLSQHIDNFHDFFSLLLIGSVFLFLYFTRKKIGFLIPGCILIGLGLGQLLDNSLNWIGDMDAIGLGFGFLLIYLITNIWEKQSYWWPLIPGVFLITVGFSDGSSFLVKSWPLILVVIGLIIIYKEFKNSAESKTKDFTKKDQT